MFGLLTPKWILKQVLASYSVMLENIVGISKYPTHSSRVRDTKFDQKWQNIFRDLRPAWEYFKNRRVRRKNIVLK